MVVALQYPPTLWTDWQDYSRLDEERIPTDAQKGGQGDAPYYNWNPGGNINTREWVHFDIDPGNSMNLRTSRPPTKPEANRWIM